MKKYTITLTEEQMRLVAEGMEDYYRFLSGECRMMNATQYIKSIPSKHFLREEMQRLGKPRMSPNLQSSSSYKWNGDSCPNENQRKAIAMSYMIYREIQHHFAMQRPKVDWNTLQGQTLICEEQGPLIKIEEVNQ